MNKMFVATQCTDDRTGEIGTFGFKTARVTNNGIRFYSLTPVFESGYGLWQYAKENNIELLCDCPEYVKETGSIDGQIKIG